MRRGKTRTLEGAVNAGDWATLMQKAHVRTRSCQRAARLSEVWLGIMIVTEITLVGWLISTPNSANPTPWFIGAFGAVVLGVGIYLVHQQVERRIDQIGKL
jgi:hypothetical protein